LVERYLWYFKFKWPMDAFNMTMKARPAYEVRFTESAWNSPRIPSRLVVNAVVQPTVHG